MQDPRPQDFDANIPSTIKPEVIDVSAFTSIKPKLTKVIKPNTIKSNKRDKGKSRKPVDQASRPSQSIDLVNQANRPIKSTSRPVQSTRPVDQSTEQLLGEVDLKAAGFYLPLSIRNKIKEASDYYQKNYHKQIDKSAIVSAMLDDPQQWKKTALDNLANRVLAQLKNKLNDRLRNRLAQ